MDIRRCFIVGLWVGLCSIGSLAAQTKEAIYTPSTRPDPAFKDRVIHPFLGSPKRSLLSGGPPKGYQRALVVDSLGTYRFYEKIGRYNYRPPARMRFDEFNTYYDQYQRKRYLDSRSQELDGQGPIGTRGIIPSIYIGDVGDRLFGGSFIHFKPNILLNVDLASRWDRVVNPALPVRSQRNWLLDMKQQLATNIQGNIGKKLNINFNYDTQSPFQNFNVDLRNNVKIQYTGFDEDIVKSLEIGNVSMASNNSLMAGSQTLFGIKSQFQFGRLYLTQVLTTQKSNISDLSLDTGTGSTLGTDFSILGSAYEADQYFFLGHFFRDHYEEWLANRPQITSGLNVTRVEVYVVNRNQNTQSLRNLLAFMDLGESAKLHRTNNSLIGTPSGNLPTDNETNQLFASLLARGDLRNPAQADAILINDFNFERSIDYEPLTSARRLNDNEYSVHPSLGYIRLNRKLRNDESLAVAYEYTYNGESFRVGELSENYQFQPESAYVFMKLLRPSRIRIELPTWDLMMKNIYTITQGELAQTDFELRIFYRDDLRGFDAPNLQDGIKTKGIPLVELMGLDLLNLNGDPLRDGNFDFLTDITVLPQNGAIVFPLLEPFGAGLARHFNDDEQDLIDRYVYSDLYRMTQPDAERLTEYNKYTLRGRYASSANTSEINLPAFGVVEGSVRLTAGSVILIEGQDYTVDYALGKIVITNAAILSSGKKIDVTYEEADLFSTRTRSFLGTRAEYRFSDDVRLGGTLFYLNDQPGSITRYPIGSEPLRNVLYGFDAHMDKEVPALTRAMDALPFVSTKAPSRVNFNTEFAQLFPGTSNQVDGQSTFYIDDFESSAVFVNLTDARAWSLAATPTSSDNRFDLSSAIGNPLGYGYKRARLAWYTIDNEFYRTNAFVNRADLLAGTFDNHYTRQVLPNEIFPQRDVLRGFQNELVLNLAYIPDERGPYNYNPDRVNGRLANPRTNWGGITRPIGLEVDFDRNNIEYLEFWLLDPFLDGERGKVYDGTHNQNNTTGGMLVFDMGDISEDAIRDGLHFYENGLQTTATTATAWGKAPTRPPLTRAFDSNAATRAQQDVGLDGLSDDEERQFFATSFLNTAPDESADPSADNFLHYLDASWDGRQTSLIQRYSQFNNPHGNTPLPQGGRFLGVGSNYPENEDLNLDNTLSTQESYYQYRIPLQRDALGIGKGAIVDQRTAGDATWYLFRIPVRHPDATYGNFTGFKSMKFIRMYLTDFQDPVVLRFVKMRFVGNQWNKYTGDLSDVGGSPGTGTQFTTSIVGLEENATAQAGKPPYVLPPGIGRDENDFALNSQRYNEQSLQLCADELVDGDARAVFRPITENLINYQHLRMFFHAHGTGLQNGDLEAFVRLGSDYSQNYYEVALPLQITPDIDPQAADVAQLVWPSANEIDLRMNELYAVKIKRDRAQFNPLNVYEDVLRQYRIRVKGRPRLSELQTILIGVRNPTSNDKRTLSGCVWANELRVTGVEKQNGWATNASVSTQLADVMQVNASMRYTSTGFGSIQDRVQQRSLATQLDYDLSTQIQLDQFIPVETGINLPLYLSQQESFSNPQYDPFNSDVPIEAVLLSYPEGEARDRYKSLVQTTSRTQSINVTNVHKRRLNASRKPRVYDIENFSLDYAYSRRIEKGAQLAERFSHQHQGGVRYSFSVNPRYFSPLKESTKLKSPYLTPIKDLNINWLPNAFGVEARLERRFMATQMRNSDFTTEGIVPVFQKSFFFRRNYSTQWSPFQSVSMSYTAQVNAIIDEPEGRIDTDAKKNEVWGSVKRLGRTQRYQQTITGNYTIPINKFPITNWMQANAAVSTNYSWTTGGLRQADTLGHQIQNGRNITLSTNLGLMQLYNQLGLAKKPAASGSPDSQGSPSSAGSWTNLWRQLLTLLEQANIQYSLQQNTGMAGIQHRPHLLGFSKGFQSPSPGFVWGGAQHPSFRYKAAQKGWLVENDRLTSPFQQTVTQSWTLQGTVVLLPDLRIQLNGRRQTQMAYKEIFRYDKQSRQFLSLTPQRTGSYRVSKPRFKGLFSTHGTSAFRRFNQYKPIIKKRLQSADNYHLNAQDVLIPAFIAAYTGGYPETIRLNPFPKWPIPGWQANYAGLSKIKSLKGVFSSVVLAHAYTSEYALGNFSSALLYESGLSLDRELLYYRADPLLQNGNPIPFYIFNNVTISDRFTPLIGLQLGFPNRMTTRINYNIQRDVSLNLSNTQIQELFRQAISFDYSFSREGMRLPFRYLGTPVVLNNLITMRAGFTLNFDKTLQRTHDKEPVQTGGNTNLQIRSSLDYTLNQFLNIQAYFDYGKTNPLLTNSFPRNNTNFGFRIRFNLSEQ